MQPNALLAESERLAVVVGALMVLLLAALDQTIVSPALPTIGAALGDVDWLAWVVSAYFLTSTAVTPLYGKLADLQGRRPTLYGAVAIFTLGSVICALAPSMPILILGRAVQGLGGGGLVSLVQTIIGDVVPPQERAKYMVYISTVWAVASIGGPLAGGVFAEHMHWSMIFWINLPLAAIAFVMIHRSLRRIPDVTRPARLDLVGAVSIVAATIAFMLALTWGGNRFAWGSAEILGLFALSLALGLFFARHIARTEEALVPLEILRNPVISVVVSALFFSMGAYVGLSVYMPLWFELVAGLHPASAGFGLLALTLGTVTGANLAGRAMAHIVHYRRFVLGGSGLAIVATVVLAVFAADLGFWGVEAVLAVVGLGTGTVFPIGTVAVQNAVLRRDLGTAMGTLAFMRSLGSVVSVTVLGAVLAAGGIAGVGEGMSHPGHVDPTAAGAFRWLFLAVVAGQVVGFVLLCFLEERPLRGHEPTAPVE
ncbi:MDR family MFS transporter [Pinisolibacter aquiterrae]|uniref:MDR family MFS transporter n=1 Tax=Pinisolibacter aquiterrae TaxID=2815579 RepID=UPI001C3E2B0C|nr:MDR family MFS transporter [Pinisolibacter aquiterrae]MBV5266056.1 MFS transporter [Pinisolibacter aquiterrae]MCC8233651.1 MFS transporter [Pinisolibacter aquiterrae]